MKLCRHFEINKIHSTISCCYYKYRKHSFKIAIIIFHVTIENFQTCQLCCFFLFAIFLYLMLIVKSLSNIFWNTSEKSVNISVSIKSKFCISILFLNKILTPACQVPSPRTGIFCPLFKVCVGAVILLLERTTSI